MIFFACGLTLTHLYMRDDSLGFEDCRLATHLLKWYSVLLSCSMVQSSPKIHAQK